jgi:calmodulin
MFDLFSTGEGERIQTDAIGHVVRALNFNPTGAELSGAMMQADPSNEGWVDWAAFQQVFPSLSSRPMNAGELNQAFSVFDRNLDGKIQISEFHYVMTNLGNKVSDESVDELVAEAQIPETESKAPYTVFTQILTAPR